jgi:hypothetical protein
MTSTEIDPAANKDYFGNSIHWYFSMRVVLWIDNEE